jgi:cap2 methyltransferase
VTADGGMDTLSDPANQETLLYGLKLAETVCALGCLRRGGAFLLKLFTCFECSTASLLRWLAGAFAQVVLCKPATSKAGNSEVYAVCLDFRGADPELLACLVRRMGGSYPAAIAVSPPSSVDPATALLPVCSLVDLPKSFLCALRRSAALYASTT